MDAPRLSKEWLPPLMGVVVMVVAGNPDGSSSSFLWSEGTENRDRDLDLRNANFLVVGFVFGVEDVPCRPSSSLSLDDPIEKSKNEVKIDQDIMVLANPEIAKLPNWVVGLIGAGGLAARLRGDAGRRRAGRGRTVGAGGEGGLAGARRQGRGG